MASEENTEQNAILKTLLERFDSLERDVRGLKQKEACRSVSASKSEAETSDKNVGRTPEGNTAVDRHRQSGTGRRRRRSSSSSSTSDDGSHTRRRRLRDARKRSKITSKKRTGRKGKSPVRNRSWADRMSDSEDESMDYSRIVFSESEAEDQPHAKLVEVSERTSKFLQEKCTRRVPNSTRRELRDRFPLPQVPATRPAQLDPILKSETSSAIKAADKQLAKVQTLVLDSLAPLTSVLEAHQKGEVLDQKDVIQAVKCGITLIGNANAHLLNLRRERIVSDINKALLPIVGDDDIFKEVAPLLFGMEFVKKSKEMVEQVKAIRSTFNKRTDRKPPFFRGGPPSRGGTTRRYGRGGAQQHFRQRDRPYPVGKQGPQQTQRRTQ